MVNMMIMLILAPLASVPLFFRREKLCRLLFSVSLLLRQARIFLGSANAAYSFQVSHWWYYPIFHIVLPLRTRVWHVLIYKNLIAVGKNGKRFQRNPFCTKEPFFCWRSGTLVNCWAKKSYSESRSWFKILKASGSNFVRISFGKFLESCFASSWLQKSTSFVHEDIPRQ